MGDTARVPPPILEDVGRTVTRAFTEAINACDAASSLERIESIRRQLTDAVDFALAGPMRLQNARLSLQNRLPPEIWFNVWARLPLATRSAITQVSAYWRELSVNCPDLWTAIECKSGQHLGPNDAPSNFFSSLYLVELALPRAGRRPLSLTISMDQSHTSLNVVDGLVTMLRPYAEQVVEIDALNCTVPQFQLLLGGLKPLSSLRHLRYDAMRVIDPNLVPPLFLQPRRFSHLKTIMLAAEWPYHWCWDPMNPMHFDGGGPIFIPRAVPFPSVEMVCFAPAHEADIAQVLYDCPQLTSLFLSLSHFQWSSGLAEILDPSQNQLADSQNQMADLHLYGVRARHVREAMGLYRAYSTTRRFSIMLTEVVFPLPVRLYFPDIVLPPVGVGPCIQPSPTTLSPPLSLGNDSLQPVGGSVGLSPKGVYRRLTKATKGMLRKLVPDADPQPESFNVQQQPPTATPSVPRPTPDPPNVEYDSSAIRCLSECFCDLVGPADVVLCAVPDGWQTAPTTNIVLRATDATGLTRTGGLRDGDRAAMPEFLSHIWRIVQPRHIACEVELFPLLLASLGSEESPATSLELLFTCCASPPGTRVSAAMPAPTLRFSRLRALRLGPRHADSAAQTVLSACDIADFVTGLGAQLPLNAITICRGVTARDASALKELAGSVLLLADPTRELELWRGSRPV